MKQPSELRELNDLKQALEFYKRDPHGIPLDWIPRAAQALITALEQASLGEGYWNGTYPIGFPGERLDNRLKSLVLSGKTVHLFAVEATDEN